MKFSHTSQIPDQWDHEKYLLAPILEMMRDCALVSQVQSLMQKITFRVNGVGISKLTRTISFNISDGDGATSTSVLKDVTVS